MIHAHDPHGIAMASLALSLRLGQQRPRRRSSPPAASTSISRATRFSRWKYRQVDCFIAASEAIRLMLVADGVPSRVARSRSTKASTSITCRDAPPVNVHEAFWLPHHAPVVGNVAALVPHKGQRHLIEAAHLVVQEMPDARFVILGEGELREQLERQVRDHHLEKHVLLPGFRTDVLGCIKGFDLFAMSSVTEGLGTSLLDAMACGKAVVATRAGGIPEVVDDRVTGLLVPPRDHPAMAAAIVRLLTRRGPAAADGRGRPRARARALHRRADGRRDRGRLRARGRQTPRSGHCESFCARLKPQAFIMPRWQSAKSYLTGSSGSSGRSDAVISRAMAPAGARDSASSRRQRPTRMTCVSSGTTSADARHRDQTPRSSASRRTIQRRNRFSRLQALPAEGRGKK